MTFATNALDIGQPFPQRNAWINSITWKDTDRAIHSLVGRDFSLLGHHEEQTHRTLCLPLRLG